MLAKVPQNWSNATFVGIEVIWTPWQFRMPSKAETGGAFQAAHVHVGQIGNGEIFKAVAEWVD